MIAERDCACARAFGRWQKSRLIVPATKVSESGRRGGRHNVPAPAVNRPPFMLSESCSCALVRDGANLAGPGGRVVSVFLSDMLPAPAKGGSDLVPLV